MMEKKKLVYADFMKCDLQGRLVLSARGTQNDLDRLGIQFETGMQVVFYNLDEDQDGNRDDLVVEGTLEFDSEENRWAAKIDWDAIANLSSLPDDRRKTWDLSDRPI